MRRAKAIILTVGAVAMIVVVVAAAGIVLFTESRNWHDSRTETKKPWGAAEIVGAWQYPSDYPKGVVTITFNPDGTFQQTVSTSGSNASISQTGHWAIESTSAPKGGGFVKGQVNIYGALMFMGDKWTPCEWEWWEVVDSKTKPGEITIFGGTAPDPDVFEEFTKASSTKPVNSLRLPAQ